MDKKEIADQGTILRVLVGSGVHGVSIANQDDRDEMGICIEPAEYVVGLKHFEQYEFRTQGVGSGRRSGPGDLDLTIYSLRKWLRLALQGNPTIILPLFVPEEEIVSITQAGRDLRDAAHMVASKQAGHRYLGYMQSQRERLLGTRGGRHGGKGRPELTEQFGFDTKFAMHMVRLGIQGVEYLETGRLTLPLPEPHRTWLKELRVGGHSQEEAIEMAEELENRVKELLDGASPLPDHPDYEWANDFLIERYLEHWNRG